jgi:hypothetical protein
MARPLGPWIWLVAALVALVMPLMVAADQRTDRLIDLLQSSGNYRIRVQSAQSLGRIREPSTVPALIDALADPHPAVRTAVAQALGRIGDRRALESLRALAAGSDQPGVVVQQAEQAIRQIQDILGVSGPSKGSTASKEIRFYLGVGDMGNTTGERPGELEKTLGRFISEELERSEGVKLAPPGELPRETTAILKKNSRWKSYYIQGAINRLEVVEDSISASVSLMILSNPGRDLRMMLSGRGSAGVPGVTKLSPTQLQGLQDYAIKAAVEGAMQRLIEQLNSQP